jgi:hypothetical protein
MAAKSKPMLGTWGEGSLSCHIYCDTGPWGFDASSRGPRIRSPLTLRKGMLRTCCVVFFLNISYNNDLSQVWLKYPISYGEQDFFFKSRSVHFNFAVISIWRRVCFFIWTTTDQTQPNRKRTQSGPARADPGQTQSECLITSGPSKRSRVRYCVIELSIKVVVNWLDNGVMELE